MQGMQYSWAGAPSSRYLFLHEYIEIHIINTLIYKHIQLDYTQRTQNAYLPYITLTEATGKDGNCISSYQVKVQPPVEFNKNHLTLPWKSKWQIGKLAGR